MLKRSFYLLAPLVVALLFLTTSARATTDLTGIASVIDGDTIEIHGQRIRLFGVDAPEAGQFCRGADGRAWRCGVEAARALDILVNRSTVRCIPRGKDRYQRVVAVCYAQGHDLAETLTREGLAVAYRRYSLDYVDAENEARRATRGLWAGAFDMPWDWRRTH